jgi:hypothetical protein
MHSHNFILVCCAWVATGWQVSNAFAQVGACCLGTGACIKTTDSGCDIVSGEFFGDGTSCVDVVCNGACCQDDKGCD